jgi:hypothetical protein
MTSFVYRLAASSAMRSSARPTSRQAALTTARPTRRDYRQAHPTQADRAANLRVSGFVGAVPAIDQGRGNHFPEWVDAYVKIARATENTGDESNS